MAEKVRVTVPVLMIRSEPSPDGAVLSEIQEDTEVELLERQPRYARVRYSDANRQVEGWAAVAMLSLGQKLNARSTVCPVCGASESREMHAGVQSSAFFFAPVHLAKRGVSGANGNEVDLVARVCIDCGYVSWFVPAEYLRRI